MKRVVVGVVVVCSAVLVGCEPIVMDVVEAQDPAVAGGNPTGGGPAANALAWKASDGTPGLVSPEAVPDALVLSFGNVEQACGISSPFDPLSGPCVAADQWQLLLSIPPELNRPALIDLADPRIPWSYSIRMPNCGGGTGQGTGGYMGTLEIVASDAASVTVKLRDVSPTTPPLFDGDYVAARCGTVPPPFAPTPAVAVHGSGLTGDPSSGTGATPDPDALYVFLGTTPGTCADPAPTVDCLTNRQMVLSLPPALQVPGDVALTDPQLDAMYTAPENSCGAAAPASGTVTITSIDDTQMTLRIYGSEWAAFDGDYVVTLCP